MRQRVDAVFSVVMPMPAGSKSLRRRCRKRSSARITVDYTVEFARVLRENSPSAVFSFLSGSGADPTGKSRMASAPYKAEAEKVLLAEGFPSVYIFRPAYIYPVEPRKEPNLS